MYVDICYIVYNTMIMTCSVAWQDQGKPQTIVVPSTAAMRKWIIVYSLQVPLQYFID